MTNKIANEHELERKRQEYIKSWAERETFKKSYDEKKFLEEQPDLVKFALDEMKYAGKILDLLLRNELISPEAMGFTTRKIDNLIERLQLIKARMSPRKG